MASIEVTHFNLEKLVTEHDLVVLDFWGEWCNPCKAFAPIFEAVSEDFPSVVFGKVDADAERMVADFLGVTSVPTTVVIRQQIPVFRQIGSTQAESLRQVVRQALALDMSVVRANLGVGD